MTDSLVQSRREVMAGDAFHELMWRKCAEDERFFFQYFAWVMSSAPEHQPDGRTLFKLWDFQEEALDAFGRYPLVAVAKVRQLGLTTEAMLDTFWRGFFQPGRYEVLIISKDQDAADTNLRMISAAYQFLPQWMKERGPVREDDASTKLTFVKPDGSKFRIVSLPGTATRGAGTTPSRIIADEFALMDKQGDVFRVLSPAIKAATSGEVVNGAAMIMISTPRGNKNLFATTFLSAFHKPEKSPWHAIYFPVTCNKFLANVGDSGVSAADRAAAAHRVEQGVGVDGDVEVAEEFWEAWDQERKQFSQTPHLFYSEWSRNVNEAFQSSSNRRFRFLPTFEDVEDFGWHGALVGDASFSEGSKRARQDVYEEDSIEAGQASWHFRYRDEELTSELLSREIVIAVDPASGVGKDDTAITVLADYVHEDGTRGVEVLAAFWDNEVQAKEVARQVALAGKRFAPAGKRAALLVVERPNAQAGDGTIIDTAARNYFYPRDRMYRHETEGRVKNTASKVFGMPMNQKTKPQVLGDLETLFVPDPDSGDRTRSLISGLYSALLQQLETYLVLSKPDSQHTKTGADAGSHDDLVMSIAIGASVLFRARERYRKPARTSTQSNQMNSVSDSPLSMKNLFKAHSKPASDKKNANRFDSRANALYGRLK
jgi:hypothetical protein